jgi:lysophospholipase L1-like esterase
MRSSAAVAALLQCAGCGTPTGPSVTPPPVTEITLTCPADIRLGSIGTPTAIVTYPAPTAVGGTPPVRVTCSPPSSSAFPLGTTSVSCAATDGVRTAACAFNVTLVPPQPVLSVLNYIAFGDSITAGENGESPLLVIDGPNSYPMQLFGLIQARYATQTPAVHNCGVPGELAQDGAGRIDNVLDFYKADVLLLLEGVNSLTGNFSQDGPAVQMALAYDIAAAKSRGMAGVFLSTLLPVFPGNCTPSGPPCRGAEVPAAEIPNMNGAIFALAEQQGVPLIDNYTAFVGHPEYIDTDGLHPLPQGNHTLAQQFLTAIQSQFEFLTPTSRRVSGVAPRAISPQCPWDGFTGVSVSRSSGR